MARSTRRQVDASPSADSTDPIRAAGSGPDRDADGTAATGRGPVRGPAGEATPPRPWQGLLSYPVWIVGAVVGGTVARLARWSDGKSLNSDELWITVNLQRRSFLSLRGPLDYDQLAPLGWLWLEKLLLTVRHSDALLRLPALVAGCAVVGLTAVVARRLLPVPLAVAAVVLVAGGPMLIYQSSQVKQYSLEAAACVLLVAVALWALDTPGRRRPPVVFWLSAAVAVWFATTAIFVAASVGGLLLLFVTLERRWRLVRLHVFAAVPAVASVATVYLMAPPPAAWLYEWWSEVYPGSLAPRPLGWSSWVTWTGELGGRFAVSSLSIPSRVVGAAVVLLMVVGAVALLARMPRHAALVVAPLATGYLLALLRLYPMASRVALWLIPIAWLLAAAGVDAVVRAGRFTLAWLVGRVCRVDAGGRRLVEGVALVLPLAAAVVLVAVLLPGLGVAPRRTNADRYAVAEEAVRFIAANRAPRDRILVHRAKGTSALAAWYGPQVGLGPYVEYATAADGRCHDERRVADLAGASRVWLLRVTWVSKKRTLRYEERTAMLRHGRLVDERWFAGIVVLLYQASPPADLRPTSAPCMLTFPVPAG
jgi:hypothetical protein